MKNTMGKVAASGGKAIGLKSQPITGKLAGSMDAMPGSKGKGQAVATVKSNPIQGSKSPQAGNSAMGAGGVIDGFV